MAFEKLSGLIHHPISYEQWVMELMPDGHPPEAQKAFDTWNKLEPQNPLICIYCSPEIVGPIVYKKKLELYRPYFWVGREPKELITKDEEADFHSTLFFITNKDVILISPLKPNSVDSTAIFVQKLNFNDIDKMTLMLFQVYDKNDK